MSVEVGRGLYEVASSDFTDQPWAGDARCAKRDPKMFYPERGGRDSVAHAKEVCACCPVIKDCLEWAIVTNEPFGIWGGLTEKERRLMPKHYPCTLPGCNRTFSSPIGVTQHLARVFHPQVA